MNRSLSLRTAEERQVRLLAVLMFLFMLLLAFIPGLRSVQGIVWDASADTHRDASFVHALLEGHYGEDPTYLGGSLWYNPLLFWVEALGVWITGLPVSTVIVRMGPYVNLLAPIAFFAMTWYFLGPVRAVICTAAFLFFSVGHEPDWAVPTYSPRLIPGQFGQWLFYVGLVGVDRAFRNTRLGPSMVAGGWAGLTFLGHAAPAIILVLIIVVFTLYQGWGAIRTKDRRLAWARLRASLAAGLAFIAVSLPLLWFLVGQYGGGSDNRAGALLTAYMLALRDKGVFLYHNVSVINLLAIVGIWLALARSNRAGLAVGARRILGAWLGLSFALTIYCYMVTVMEAYFGIHLPVIVPSFHFYFYLKGALTVFAGLAAWELLARAYVLFRPSVSRSGLSLRPRAVAALFALIAIGSTLNYPAYANRRALFAIRNRDLAFAVDTDAIEMEEKVRSLLPWDAVVLCDEGLSLWPMLPTARKLLATAPTMGNPYMDQTQRMRDRDLLLLGMKVPRPETRALLDERRITHLLVRPSDLATMPYATHWFPRTVFRNDGYILLAR